MGLSGRKTKQRIPNDPRNLGWADDAARFGSAYLSKFGWDPSKGLGVAGDGRISHLKVSQKLDMLGIGAAQQRDPNGIAWKQNRDFENLLMRLNENTAENEPATETANDDVEMVEAKVDAGEMEAESGEKQGKKKRKKDTVEAEPSETVQGDGKKERKKKRKEKEKDVNEAAHVGDDSKREVKKRRRDKADPQDEEQEKPTKSVPSQSQRPTESSTPIEGSSSSTPLSSRSTSARPVNLRHRAHRARAIAAKNITSKSSSAIAEILGIASTSISTTASASDTPIEGLAPTECEVVEAMEKLTTSTKTVSDYFKEKLLMKSKSGTTTPAAATPPVRSETTIETETWDDTPKRGLGSSMLGAQLQVGVELTETERLAGIGNLKFSQHLSTMFSSTTPSATESEVSDKLESSVAPTEATEGKKKKKRKTKEHEVDVHTQMDATSADASTSEPSGEASGERVDKKEKKRKKRKAAEIDIEAQPPTDRSTSKSKDKAEKKSREKGHTKREESLGRPS